MHHSTVREIIRRAWKRALAQLLNQALLNQAAGSALQTKQAEQAQQPTTAGAARTIVAKHVHHQRQQLVLHFGKQLCREQGFN